MRERQRVCLREDPTQIGTVFTVRERRAFVVWDGAEEGGGYDFAELRSLEQRHSNPPLIHAPEISDLQYVSRLDPDTDTVYTERDDNYRGRRSELPQIDNAEDIAHFFRYMGELDREHIVVGLLNIRNELTGWKMVHSGELASVEASGRQIIRDALLGNAAGIFILHNHPTGDPTPSDADKDLTNFLAKMAKDWDICFFDHVIIGVDADHHGPYYSFRDDGQLPEDSEEE